jgi:hypothetical protein
MKVGQDQTQVYFGRKGEPGPTLATEEKKDPDRASFDNEGQAHFENFIDCVRSRKLESLRAPLEEGHLSTTLCHLGNIAYRVGRSVKFNGVTERFVDDEEADNLLGRTYRAPYSLPEKS